MQNPTEKPTPAQPELLRGRDRRHQFPGRHHRLNLRLDPTELAAISTAAATAGLTPTGFCTEAALAAAHGEAASGPGSDRDALRRVQWELFALRTAVTQIATTVHQSAAEGNTSAQLPGSAQAVLQRCRQAVDRLDAVSARIRRRLS